MNSSLVIRRPAFSTRNTSVSKTFGVSATGSPWRNKIRSAGSRRNAPNSNACLVEVAIGLGLEEVSRFYQETFKVLLRLRGPKTGINDRRDRVDAQRFAAWLIPMRRIRQKNLRN